MSEEKKEFLLTKEGVENLEKELKQLIEVKRPEVIKLIQDAREQGDLSENADYDAAKNLQAEIEKRISEIQNILNYAKIIENNEDNKNKVVKIGCKVTIHDLSDKEDNEYEIVGEVEADPDQNKISNLSPLAKAILNRTVGEVVKVQGTQEPYSVKILKIKY